MISTTTTPLDGARLPQPWSAALPSQRCNFHHEAPATLSYAGTPMCAACSERVLRQEPQH